MAPAHECSFCILTLHSVNWELINFVILFWDHKWKEERKLTFTTHHSIGLNKTISSCPPCFINDKTNAHITDQFPKNSIQITCKTTFWLPNWSIKSCYMYIRKSYYIRYHKTDILKVSAKWIINATSFCAQWSIQIKQHLLHIFTLGMIYCYLCSVIKM